MCHLTGVFFKVHEAFQSQIWEYNLDGIYILSKISKTVAGWGDSATKLIWKTVILIHGESKVKTNYSENVLPIKNLYKNFMKI